MEKSLSVVEKVSSVFPDFQGDLTVLPHIFHFLRFSEAAGCDMVLPMKIEEETASSA